MQALRLIMTHKLGLDGFSECGGQPILHQSCYCYSFSHCIPFFPIFFFQYSISINQSSVLQQKHINTKTVRKFLIGLRKQFLTSYLLVQNHLERILNQDDLMIFLILVHHTQYKFYLLFQLNHNLQSTSKEHKLMKKYFKSLELKVYFFVRQWKMKKSRQILRNSQSKI